LTGSAARSYWTPPDIANRELIILKTRRLAKLYRVNSDGRMVFITPTALLLCEHGECAPAITSWVIRETQAELDGLATPKRESTCNCLNTDGMYFTEAKPDMRGIFSFLEGPGTKKLVVHGRVARHVPRMAG
jgi:hypothetical protein